MSTDLDQSVWNSQYYAATSLEDWDLQNYNLRSINRKGSYYFTNIDNTNYIYEYRTEVNAQWRNALPIFVNQMN
jgi:ATP-binding cassette subfamily A (ABC1) protein 3